MRTRLLLLLLLFATAIRLVGLQTQSLWFDEGWSAYAAAQPSVFAAFDADLTNPPLYYVLLKIHAAFLGESVFSLRLFSLFNGLLTIPLSYQLARRVAGKQAGWYAALLVTLSAPLGWASQEARMYTLLAVLILIAALAWERLRTQPSRGAWIALGAAELCLLYAHNTGIVAALWLNVVTLIAWLVRRDLKRPHWRDWIISQVIVGLIWLPYFFDRFLRLSDANSAVSSAPQVSFAFLGELWQSFMIAPYALVNQNTLLAALCVLTALIALVAFQRRAAWLTLHVIVLTAGLVAALIVLGNNFHGRYVVMIAPLLLTAVGVGLAGKRYAVVGTRHASSALRLTALIIFAALFAVNWWIARDPLYGHDDARGMVQYYADHLTADDTVLAWSYADRYEFAYYWDRLGAAAQRVTLPEGADLERVLPLLPPTGGDVALNVWYTQRADYRGMMDCILQHGTLKPPERFTTYGMSNLLYAAPTPLSPEFTPVDATFADSAGAPVARIEAVGILAPLDSAAGMCVPIRLTLLAPYPHELKAALIVQNALGWEIARADAPFAQADQRTTADTIPGGALTAFPLIRLPYGAPSGDYRVYVRLYDEQSAVSGLTPPADQPAAGRDLLLGVWSAPAADWSQRADLPPVTLTLPIPESLSNGESIRVGLLWTTAPQAVTLSDDAGRWSVELPAPDGDAPLQDWRAIRVPTDALSGTATLRLDDGTGLAAVRIGARPMLTAAPPFDHSLDAEYPGVGMLIGYTVNAPPYDRANPPRLTLIWRAEAAPAVDYTVFAQLIGADGVVIAQSDQFPGGLATSSWRTGEYIVDEHTLTFNVEPRAGRLVVGLYDARTNTRVRLGDGSDAVELQD
ncbi:MAG: glycosyltransferase family 39 protein [Anaerolinea sp.]|nr:glycosyltransferase family 39 protein [Anaerolinea sp.]